MKFVHRIGFRPTPLQRRELELLLLGVNLVQSKSLPGNSPPLVTFDVAEDHPNWSILRPLFRQWDVSDFLRTEFTQEEFAAAEWLEFGAWHHGYPQPETVFGYLAITYDLTAWCNKCGVGPKQKAPFRMKGEPRWGRNGIIQLNWVFDEVFVKPDVWSTVFQPHGIARGPVLDTKGRELKTVVQLMIEEEIGIATDGLAHELCSKCGRVKYLPVTRGPSPPLISKPTRAIVKTMESFGSGAAADKRVLIAQKVAHSLATAKFRGATLRPVQRGADTITAPFTASVIEAWRLAGKELGVEIQAPFRFTASGRTHQCLAYFPHFGTPKGILVMGTYPPGFDTDPSAADDAASANMGCSFINVERYRTYNEEQFRSTLSEWGYFGPEQQRPHWLP